MPQWQSMKQQLIAEWIDPKWREQGTNSLWVNQREKKLSGVEQEKLLQVSQWNLPSVCAWLQSQRAFRNAIKIKFAASWCNTLRALHAAPKMPRGRTRKKKTLLGLLWGTRSTKLGLLGTVSERLGHAIRGAETPTLPPRNGRGLYMTSCRLPRTASARLRRSLKTTRQNCQSVCLEF